MFLKEKIQTLMRVFSTLEISWQVYSILALYGVITVAALFLQWQVGLMMALLLMVVLVFLILYVDELQENIMEMANTLSRSVLAGQDDAFYQAPIGIVLYDSDQHVRWLNPLFNSLFKQSDLLGKALEKIHPVFSEILKLENESEWIVFEIDNRHYRVLHRSESRAIYLIDISEEIKIQKNKDFNKIAFGALFLDDYNEILDTLNDQQVAELDSVLMHEISGWAQEYGIYTKRIDEEKFILITNRLVLEKLEKDKFSFFDELRERNHDRNVPMSISIGFAYPDDDHYRVDLLEKQAQRNMELAMGRGGDQIVVQSPEGKARFYGGRTNPTEKRTNIRSRLVYQALSTQIQQVDQVLITGHKRPDTDSISSAIGMAKIVRDLGSTPKIVLDEAGLNKDIRQLLALPNPGYSWEELFVTEEEALDWLSNTGLIIMVDHHRPSLSEAEQIIQSRDNDIIIIDHHRRGEEFPDNVSLSYIEVYASSAAELITEFFMNTHTSQNALNKFEATALLSGIIVDTNNFAARTGSRTFDAASYLRSRGADMAVIRRILKEDLGQILKRSKLLESLETYGQCYAIVCGPDDAALDNVTAAQTADDMLTISGVEASFVIYRIDPDTVGISARSLGDINVQLIMERLNGGGHLSNAATQIPGVTIQEAHHQLIESIKIEEGDG